MILLTAGFDNCNVVDNLFLGQGFWSGKEDFSNLLTINPSAGVLGSGALAFTGSNVAFLIKNLMESPTTFITGFAINYTAFPTDAIILSYVDGTTVQVSLACDSAGTLSAYTGAHSSLLGSSSVALTTGYNYVEFKATVDPSSGSVYIQVNNVNTLTVTGAVTQESSNSYLNTIYLGNQSFPDTSSWFIDDVYMEDDSGFSPYNDFLGSVHITTLFPAANGIIDQFSPGGLGGNTGVNFSNVNEHSENADYNYVYGQIPGTKDLYSFDTLPSSGTVYSVQICTVARCNNLGVKQFSNTYHSGSTNVDEPSNILQPTYGWFLDISTEDPNTSSMWTQSGINAAQFGAKVIE